MLAALKVPSTRRTVHRYVAAPGVSSSLTSLPSIRSSPSPERRGHSTSPSRFYRRDEHARLHHSINLPVLGCVWPSPASSNPIRHYADGDASMYRAAPWVLLRTGSPSVVTGALSSV
jgi:hypothetical protein